MSSFLDQMFEHSSVLKSHESDVFEGTIFDRGNDGGGEEVDSAPKQQTVQIFSSVDSAAFEHSPYSKNLIERRDFISLLKLGWNKVYDQDPEFKSTFDPKNGIDDLEETLLAGPWTQAAKGRTRKHAQHHAAANVLLDIVASGRHMEFLIPGRDATEANQILTSAKQIMLNEQIATMQQQGLITMTSVTSVDVIEQQQIPRQGVAPQQQTQNWVGRVQEFVMKKRIVCKWKDDYKTLNEQTNNVEHNCVLEFEILDAAGQNLVRRLEGDGRAKNKKLAKQIAFSKIYEQLVADYGALKHPSSQNSIAQKAKNTSNARSILTPNLEIVSPAPQSVAQSCQQQSKDSPEELSSNNNNNLNKYELVLSLDDLVALEHIERSQSGDEILDIRMLLSDILSDRERNTARSEQLLRRILKWKNSAVEGIFGQAELKFIETKKSQTFDIFQVYLEVFVGLKRILYCTFGGEGANLQLAKDDACWQAMEFLYIFGGFAPINGTPTIENEQ